MGRLASQISANIIPTAPEQFRGPTPNAPEMSRPGFGFGGGGVAGPQPGFGSGFGTLPALGSGSPVAGQPVPGYNQPGFVPSMPIAGQPGWQPNMPMVPNLPYNPTMMDDFGRQGGARGQAGGFGNAPSFGSSVGVLSGGGTAQPTYGNGAQLGSMMGSYNNPGYQQSIMSLFNNLFGGTNTYMR